MRIDVLTIFPEIFESPLRTSLLGKALQQNTLEVVLTDVREFARDKHHTVDDAPYGGGPGMVMKPEPLFAAVEALTGQNSLERIVLLSARGRRVTQQTIREWSKAPDIVLVCGRYEGVDERVAGTLCTDEVCVGDFVVSGGELPALAIIEGLSRMIPGVVGDFESVKSDSFYNGILGPPQYTRPPCFRGMEVPETLRNGNHAAIGRWRRKEALRATRARRKDLLAYRSGEDEKLLEEIETEEAGAAAPEAKRPAGQ